MQAQQIFRHRRDQRTRQQEREYHGEHHAFRHRHEQEARDAAQKEHRNENDADAQQGHKRRDDDLRGAIEDRGFHWLALFEVVVDALDRHRRLVDEYAHSEGEPPQGHDVERFADGRECGDRAQDRQWNRGGHDQSRAPAAEKQEDHEAGQCRGDHPFADHAVDRGAHEYRLIADRLDIERVRQRRFDDCQHLPDSADNVERRGRSIFEDADKHRAIAVDVDDIGLYRTAVVHVGDVVHVDHRAPHVLDRQIAKVRDFRWRAVEVDGVFVTSNLFRAYRGDQVLCGKRIGDVEPGQAARLERCGVEVEHHLRRLAAERPGDARTLNSDQARAHEVDPEVGEVLLGQSDARQRELDHRHRRGAVIDDQRRRRAGRHLLEQGLRNRGDLCVGGGNVGGWVEVDLDDAEGGIGIRLDVLDVVDRRRQCALKRGDDAPGHLVGRQALVLPGHADDRNVDARKNIDRHAQRGERADDENEQGRHHKGVGPAQRNADYGKHVYS